MSSRYYRVGSLFNPRPPGFHSQVTRDSTVRGVFRKSSADEIGDVRDEIMLQRKIQGNSSCPKVAKMY